jgi:hypothetical protein
MELEDGVRENQPKGYSVVNQAHIGPSSHNGRTGQASKGNRRSFEILGLASLVLGQHRHGDVESGEASEATQNVEGEYQLVDEGVESNGEAHRCRSHTEGDLYRISLSRLTCWARRTRSARESSSCPMSDDFFLHRATFPSKKSKNRPKGMKPKASQRWVRVPLGREYFSEERTDMNPQKPIQISVEFRVLQLWTYRSFQ